MRLEDLRVELRPRSPWEAVDLGLVLVRAWRRPVYAAWLAVFLPAAVLATAAGGWGLLALWWLKPLLDRIPLEVLGRSVFGESRSLFGTLRSLPRLMGGWLFDALLRHRFDPARSLHLPTWQLEGLRGDARRARVRVLDPGVVGVAVGLTATSLLMELGLACALLLSGPMLVPAWVDVDWSNSFALWWAGAGAPWVGWLVAGSWLASVALLEPVHVACGFALYLNRRTQLEGWDLEIAFRRLAARAVESKSPPTARRRGGAAVVVLAAALLTAGAVRAQGPTEEDVEAAAARVLESPEFERQVVETRWRLRDDLLDWLDRKEAPRSLPLSELLAAVLEVALWTLAIVLAAWALLRGLRAVGGWGAPSRRRAEPAPRVVAGLDITPESLPEDPAGVARRLWLEEREVEALGLLYRASLSRLVERDGLELRESFTELDCLEAASGRLPPEAESLFRRLTLAWQAAAYAHRSPDGETMEPLLSGWTLHFGAAS